MSNPARHFSRRFVDFEYTSSNLFFQKDHSAGCPGKHDGFKDILADNIQATDSE